MTDTRTAAAPMSPGTYLRKRRIAAGLSIEQLAALIAAAPRQVIAARGEIEAMERDALRAGAAEALIRRLRNFFPFDGEILATLRLLAADPESSLPRPMVCRRCACSWHDPCLDEARGSCAWAEEGERPLCTFCRTDEPEPGDVVPPPANDGEVRNAA
jgi:transcriptional regulator with XRE-family HTH domain